jgi:uncharacterized BrkB/YihY/UPF0761 family membrane protein
VSLIRSALRWADRIQRRYALIGLPYALNKKVSDDRGGLWVVALGWYGFAAIFPLLLAAVAVLGFVGAAHIGTGVVATLKRFPIIGPSIQVGHDHLLSRSVPGLVVGVLGLIYGAQGVTETAQAMMAEVWNIPRVMRRGFVGRLGRSVLALAAIGLSFLANAAVTGFADQSEVSNLARTAILVALAAGNALAYWGTFVVLAPYGVLARCLWPGAVLGGLGFTALITVGTSLVAHQLAHSSNAYGTFGSVISFVLFLLILARITVYAAELNPVLERHLYPRALTSDDPTRADMRVLVDLVRQEKRRKDQRIGVRFAKEASGPTDANGDAPTGKF